jgi:hypothetical protein
VVYIQDRPLRIAILNELIQLWRDPDSEVRATSIKMIHLMGSSGVPEVLEGFKNAVEKGFFSLYHLQPNLFCFFLYIFYNPICSTFSQMLSLFD